MLRAHSAAAHSSNSSSSAYCDHILRVFSSRFTPPYDTFLSSLLLLSPPTPSSSSISSSSSSSASLMDKGGIVPSACDVVSVRPIPVTECPPVLWRSTAEKKAKESVKSDRERVDGVEKIPPNQIQLRGLLGKGIALSLSLLFYLFSSLSLSLSPLCPSSLSLSLLSLKYLSDDVCRVLCGSEEGSVGRH
jgi:hypothetical protein